MSLRRTRYAGCLLLLLAGPVASDEVVEKLRSADPAVRAEAAATVQVRFNKSHLIGGDPKVLVPLLVPLLKESDVRVRRAAAGALATMAGGLPREQTAQLSLAGPLESLLVDPELEIRRAAAQGLAGLGERAATAVPLLVRSLKDPASGIAVDAAEALGKVGPPARGALPSLKGAAGAASPELRETAAQALRRIDGPFAVEQLIVLLRHQEAGVRLTAARSLAEPGDLAGRVLQPLRSGLRDIDPAVRSQCARSLGTLRSGARGAVPDLIAALRDQATRGAALSALEQIGADARAAAPALRPLLKVDPEVSIAAARALWQVSGDPEAVAALVRSLKALRVEDRRLAAYSLGDMRAGAALSVPALTAALQQSDVRDAAVESLGRLGPAARAAVPELIDLILAGKGNHAVGEALERIGPGPGMVPKLAEALQGEPERQALAARVLGTMRAAAKPAVPALAAAFRHRSSRSWTAIAEALRKLGPHAAAAAPALAEAMWDPDPAREQDNYYRITAVQLLRDIGPSARSAVPALKRALADPVLGTWARQALERIQGRADGRPGSGEE